MSSSSPLIVVVNHKAANIHSVDKALQRVGANAIVSSSADDLASASAAVLPGVGSSDAAMRALRKLDLIEPLKDFAASGRPLLGVCLGMQLLFDSSQEGDMPGLGLIPGEVKRMAPVADGAPRKIPHMGWNSVLFSGDGVGNGGLGHPLFDGTEQNSYFYFVHSYECVPADPDDVLATTEYGTTICAAAGRGNVVGTQFHPEKSHDLGLRLYENFVQMASGREHAVRA
ncbi:MAG: imidazole glycerol phosphate synthase subunit HisH [Chloroflexi bacterium]|nr:imidazole glycerol phosphate synthase subunit HisH [Chloroflexota bacterium]MCH8223409.1 imidazole glycerol phosphate synthase subunit HisH [Chloroflexota bacterium]